MKNSQKIFFVTAATFAILMSALNIKAQTTKSYLFNMDCQSRTPEIKKPLRQLERAQEIKLGKKKFKEIAFLYNKYVLTESGEILDNSVAPAEVICALPSGFSQLNLEFGLDRNSKVTDKEDVVLVEVYKGKNLVSQRYITRDKEKQNWFVDIQNAQNVTIRADCINPEWWNNCPRLSFTDISLN